MLLLYNSNKLSIRFYDYIYEKILIRFKVPYQVQDLRLFPLYGQFDFLYHQIWNLGPGPGRTLYLHLSHYHYYHSDPN